MDCAAFRLEVVGVAGHQNEGGWKLEVASVYLRHARCQGQSVGYHVDCDFRISRSPVPLYEWNNVRYLVSCTIINVAKATYMNLETYLCYNGV